MSTTDYKAISIEKIALKGATWLALFKIISQSFSWVITIMIARILLPSDYGLMAMAAILSGYASYLSELGIGSAIIQKEKVEQNELSAVFWFIMLFSILLSAVCFIGAYFMAYIFNEPRIIPLTQTISAIFILEGLQIVPLNLLKKELGFKKVGLIEMTGTVIASASMFLIAYYGGGVWTLVAGSFILSLTKLILIYSNVKWFPQLHFSLKDAKSYLKYGINVTIGRSFFYLFESSDKFFAGRAWIPQMLGHYTFALGLAQIPTEKIVVLINQVSFPVLSKLQNDKEAFNKFYIKIVEITATLAIPIFIGGYLIGEDIIKLLLNDKWYPIIPVFKYLCLTQIFTALNAINSFVHYSQGRPQWSLYYHVVLAISMATSFYIAVQYGLNAILIPWFTTYIIACVVWIIITLKSIGINLITYLKILSNSIVATFAIAVGIILSDYIIVSLLSQNIYLIFSLALKITLSILIYIGYYWFFHRHLFYSLLNLRKAQSIAAT